MKQAHLLISGFVQGVGYRKFVQNYARKLALTGWVKNLADGRVEVIVQGSHEKIQELLRRCEKGPMLSEVRDISLTWEDPLGNFSEFSISR